MVQSAGLNLFYPPSVSEFIVDTLFLQSYKYDIINC